MKNPNHLTMADKSALNLLAKVTNKFESEGTILSELVNFASSVPDFRRSNKGNIRHRLRDMLILIVFARASGRVTALSFKMKMKDIAPLTRFG